MAEKLGVVELKEIVVGLLALQKMGVEVFADGKISTADLAILAANVPSVAVAVYKAVEGADKLPAELSDLSAAEGAELVAFVVASQTVSDEKAKAIIECSFRLAIDLGLLIKAITA